MANCGCNSGVSEVKTICGAEIDPREQAPSAVYRGAVLYFCTPGCLLAFEADPEGFLAAHIEPQE
jgi:YHS domain-containing protein